ncbi:SPL family radical SAM protein [Anaerocolumna sp. MB42-C2]|uniref:SPL family radical SAM protein n=1 Tax=Anaerocolumna sp. MB42-C2 TaxID=3070997 RepID=UPI0027E14811|nr:radical SAM protein [Anaerocolumna sp. MB42-C2]WMJ88935.1 radical SAM protein [Anaerocolumna sp. MB42-C2]
MNNSGKNLYNPYFSHIYIENDVKTHPKTREILSQFPNARHIFINHYKDIFNRGHQNYSLQKTTPNLILAQKKQPYVYEGAPVCQDFGNQHFYYSSSVMNCYYDCEYCYLQGMYPSANLVIFVNLEDIFNEVENLLKSYPVYLCISYDTDLLALENKLGYVKEWHKFVGTHPDLTIELRTKSANYHALNNLEPLNNFILAWTLTPDSIQKNCEHHTPALDERLKCIKQAMAKGFSVRLCFDPMIYQKHWKLLYEDMINTVFSGISADKIKDVSLGVFRVSHEYMKQMRKQRPNSIIIQYPYENDNGVCHYGKQVSQEMISYTYNLVKGFIPEKNIYVWKETQ